MIGHPDERRLLGFHEGRLPDGERRRIAMHLADCQRCRNVIQGHRAVRQVFQLEASPAPGGVLERVLATRASGGVMVLPVADPGHGRRVRGSVIAVIGAAAVALLSVVQVIPMRPFAAAWDKWSRTVVDWRLFGGGDGEMRIPDILRTPIAAPAKIDPSRIRPMTLRYQSINFRRAPLVPSVYLTQMRLTKTAPGVWGLATSWNAPLPSEPSVEIDSVQFEPARWSRTISNPLGWSREEQYRFDGKWLLVDVDYSGTPDRRFTDEVPGGRLIFGNRQADETPVLFNEGHWVMAMMAVPLSEGWSGSFTFVDRSLPMEEATRPAVSYMVEGSERLQMALGTFDTWRVRALGEYRIGTELYYFRKSDGLLLMTEHDSGTEQNYREELVSVTYP